MTSHRPQVCARHEYNAAHRTAAGKTIFRNLPQLRRDPHGTQIGTVHKRASSDLLQSAEKRKRLRITGTICKGIGSDGFTEGGVFTGNAGPHAGTSPETGIADFPDSCLEIYHLERSAIFKRISADGRNALTAVVSKINRFQSAVLSENAIPHHGGIAQPCHCFQRVAAKKGFFSKRSTRLSNQHFLKSCTSGKGVRSYFPDLIHLRRCDARYRFAAGKSFPANLRDIFRQRNTARRVRRYISHRASAVVFRFTYHSVPGKIPAARQQFCLPGQFRRQVLISQNNRLQRITAGKSLRNFFQIRMTQNKNLQSGTVVKRMFSHPGHIRQLQINQILTPGKGAVRHIVQGIS